MTRRNVLRVAEKFTRRSESFRREKVSFSTKNASFVTFAEKNWTEQIRIQAR